MFLERRFGSSGIEPLKKLAVDQMFMAPLLNTAGLILLETMRGNNLDGIKYKLTNVLPDILKNQYKLWPAAQLVNFYFIPLQYK